MKQDEGSLGSILKSLFLLGLFAYILPVLLGAATLIGAGIGIGYLIWGH